MTICVRLGLCFIPPPHLLFSGDFLQQRYKKATRVKHTRQGRLKVKSSGRSKVSSSSSGAAAVVLPTAHDLVFLKKSPNYCHYNESIGTLGKSGKIINP